MKVFRIAIRVFIFLLLFVFSFAAVYPLIFLLGGSLKSTAELGNSLASLWSADGTIQWTWLPFEPTLRHYVELLLDEPGYYVMFWNSVKIAGGVIGGQLLLSLPAAWGFARLDIPGKKVLFNLYIILMLMPFQVTMLSNYLTLNAMHLMDTQWAVILPAAFSTFPVFIMYHFFRSIPKGIIESAELDGANKFQVFLHIGVPLGSSGIVSALVLSFLDAWNLIEQPLTFLKNKTLWPLSLYLPNISMDNAGLAFVASVITLIPSLLVFMAGQNYLEQGIAASAVKE